MDVSPGEKITRFIRYSDDFDEPNTVRQDVFLPHKRKVDISVFRITELSCNAVWEIAWERVQTDERPVYARADLLASSVYENNLKVIPETRSHELHANITGFPPEREENKTADRRIRRAIARRLALASELVMPPKQN